MATNLQNITNAELSVSTRSQYASAALNEKFIALAKARPHKHKHLAHDPIRHHGAMAVSPYATCNRAPRPQRRTPPLTAAAAAHTL